MPSPNQGTSCSYCFEVITQEYMCECNTCRRSICILCDSDPEKRGPICEDCEYARRLEEGGTGHFQ